MKNFTLLLFIFISFVLQSIAQVKKDTSEEHQVLLKVKSVLEKNFAGTKYRGIQKDFKIDDSLSKQYRLYGTATELISSTNLEKLNNQLNNVLKANKQLKLDCKVYFDFFLDSTIVDLEYRPDGIIYKFIALGAAPAPPKGYGAFAKRMHDFLKQQLVNNKVSKDSLQSVSSAKFIEKIAMDW